jgi:PadR family transcriptional regulator
VSPSTPVSDSDARQQSLPFPPQTSVANAALQALFPNCWPCLTQGLHFSYIVYLMSVREYLGEFEHIVLLAVLRLGDQAYGVTIRREIEARTRREVSIGAIYATLDRLEAKNLVQSRLGDPTPERGGRSKRFFLVTAQGVSAVKHTHRALCSLTEGLALLGSSL